MIKGSIQQEVTIIVIYASNMGVPKYIKGNIRRHRGKIDSNTKIVVDFNTPLTSKDRSSRQKMDKKVLAVSDILHQNKLIDI